MAEHIDIKGYEKLFGLPFWRDLPAFTVHAFVAGISAYEGGTEISLEIAEAESFERRLKESPENAVALFSEVSSSPARCELRSGDNRFLGIPLDEAEGQWRTLHLDRRKVSDMEIRLLATFADPEGTAFYVQSVMPTPQNIIAAHSFPLGTVINQSDVTNILSGAQRPHLEVAMLDVGQGASAFVYDSSHPNQHKPALYFDLGGGVGKNAFTNPVGGVHWCFTSNPPVILSHWHWDHYAGATYGGVANMLKAAKATWIGPARPCGTHANKFKSMVITSGGKINLWPTSLPPVTVGSYTLGLANGSTCNDSGLVLLVESPVGQFTLLPGDASYTYIAPSISNKYAHGLRTLIATHHAGAFAGGSIPLPDGFGGNMAVFSAGPGNTYGHPSATGQHMAVGWAPLIGTNDRLGLPVRHRQASTGGITAAFNNPACGGGGLPNCSLCVYQ